MNTKIDNSLALLEWETFDWPQEFSHISLSKGIYNLPSNTKVSVYRNSEYKLTGNATGTVKNKDDIEYNGGRTTPEAGEFMETETISGKKPGYETFTLKDVLLGANSLTFSGSSPNPDINFKAEILTWEFECENINFNPQDTSTLLEFYLCGQNQFFWPRSTDRKKTTKTAKVRVGIDEESIEADRISYMGGGGARDFLFIDTTEYAIIVQQVDSQYLPEWGNGIQFEYRAKLRPIPEKEERKAISEIVSFVLGTHLLKIGDAEFDQVDNLLKRTAYSP